MTTWRSKAQSVIAPIERDATDLVQLKRALFAAYPFGRREYTPYKIWCQEQRKAIARFRARTEPQPWAPQTGDLPGLEG